MPPAPITPASVQIPADLDAPVIVDFDVHALRMALVERESVLKLSDWWIAPGVYVLLGALGGGTPTEVYVGKAVRLRDRLSHHRAKPKIAWWRAIAVARDTTARFNSAEIGYLEGRLASELEACPQLELAAGRKDVDLTLPQHVRIQLDSFVPTILAGLRSRGLTCGSA